MIVTGWPVTITFFNFKIVSYCIAIMNDDIGKFGYDSINKNKKDKINEKYLTIRTFKVTFLTCNVFVFYKNLLCRLQSSCSYSMM